MGTHIFRFLPSVFLFTLLSALPSAAAALVILQYHHISDDTPKSTSTSPAQFKQHLDWIAESGYKVISIEQLAKALRSGKQLEDKTVVITFDDGFKSIYKSAFPFLKKRGWPFTVFVNTRAHDQKLSSHMSWSELRELMAHGATVANHSISHTHLLRRNNDGNAARIFEREIAAAENRIKEETGVSLKLFAYPYGEYDRAITQQLEQHGYLGFGQNSGAVASDVDSRRIPRFPFGGHFGNEQDFKTKLRTLAVSFSHEEALDEHGRKVSEPDLPQVTDKPLWRLSLDDQLKNRTFSCFVSGQGAARVRQKGRILEVQAKQSLKPGRSKYNCTASAGGGRFYWVSKLWIKKAKNGQWVHD